MKTKNNVQKTILRSLAVVISFVLISFTVSAQDFWKKLLTNSSFNEIALAMIETSDKNTDTESVPADSFNYALLENEAEPGLELEAWMNDESYFGVESIQIVEETEINLELEAWMFDDNFFQVDENSEMSLELEAWMTSEKVWEM